jgi:nicotinamide-nucleotide adenylyltransferase
MTTALFIGRFQPFHLGHLSAIKEILNQVDKIIIGIGSSQFSNTKENPFNFNERLEMIKKVLTREKLNNYKIYPIKDTFDDEEWLEEIKKTVPKFDIIFTSNPHSFKIFKDKGFKVKKVKIVKAINGSTIRERMLKNENWERLVPTEVIKYIYKIKGVKRVKRVMKAMVEE